MAVHFKARGLNVGYGAEPLIRDIDIELERGEILTLIPSRASWRRWAARCG